MKRKLTLITTIFFLFLAIFAGMKINSSGTVFHSIAVHSLIEGVSSFCSLFLAFFFLVISKYESHESPYLYSSAGLFGMGTLDFCHAIVDHGNVFVWLRAMASLMGALGFSLIWLRRLFESQKTHLIVPFFFLVTSSGLAAFSVLNPEDLPRMIVNGVFTSLAIQTHIITGFLFIAASMYYFFLIEETYDERNLFLGSFCFLQALASFLFSFCNIWTLEWWWWHVLRSLAAMVLIWYVFFLQIKLQRRLELAVTLRDEFIAIASHELKTPLSAMKLQAQMLQKYEGQKDKFDWITKMFNKEITRITNVVDELLEISRITSGQLSMNKSETNMGNVLRDVITLLQEEFQSSGQKLDLDIEDDVIGNWDESRLAQVMINFLTNAKKYGEGRTIDVKVSKKDNTAVLSVKDQGIGISKEDMARLFNRFERLEKDRNSPGLGVGLFITKKIAEAHSGRIEVKSSPGVGTEFIFILPMTKVGLRE